MMLLAYVLPDKVENLMPWKSNQLLSLQSQVRKYDLVRRSAYFSIRITHVNLTSDV